MVIRLLDSKCRSGLYSDSGWPGEFLQHRETGSGGVQLSDSLVLAAVKRGWSRGVPRYPP